MRVAWKFRDKTTDPVEEYTWEINPKEMSVAFTKKINYSTTAAPDGRVLMYEGRQEPVKINFSGTILSEDQYIAMVYWFSKTHQIEVENDLGQIGSIYITSFTPRRDHTSRNYPWKHEYSCEAIVLDWTAS